MGATPRRFFRVKGPSLNGEKMSVLIRAPLLKGIFDFSHLISPVGQEEPAAAYLRSNRMPPVPSGTGTGGSGAW